jgi:hypothetical protein
MPDFIRIENAGQGIHWTDYWDSEQARAGKVFLSVNAGCIRLLLPDPLLGMLAEMKTGKKVIVSRGPWPDYGRDDGFEIMFEDYSDSPFALHVGVESWDLVPARDTIGKKWEFAIWTRAGKMYQKKCYYRTVARIPCMKPWGEK